MEYPDSDHIIGLLQTEAEKTSDSHKQKVIGSFIAGIRKYGYNKPLIAPRKVTWDLTTRCNLSCQHCSNKEVSYGEDLDTESIMRVLEKLSDFGIQHISFSGGEPFLRKDIFSILRRAKELGIALTIATNATLIDEEKASTLRQIGVDSIQSSIDGIGASHDSFRGMRGAFERAVKGIQCLVSAGLTVVVTTTLMARNVGEVQDIINLCTSMGVHAYLINDLIPVGCGRTISGERLTNEQYAMCSRFFDEQRSALEGTLELLWGGVGTFKGKKKDEDRLVIQTRCLACFHRFNIAADGTVQPCNLLPLTAGSIVTERVEDIWNSPLFAALRDRNSLKGRCGRCDYRYSCGGCRARAYAVSGDYFAEDPRCQRGVHDENPSC